jgi:hypothetical protein
MAVVAVASLPAFASDQKPNAPRVMPDPNGGKPRILPDPGTENDKKDDPFVYAPDGCDFQITFPEAPYNTRRCPDGGKQCYQLTTYTMVYDLRTTVDISVTCNPSTPADYMRYDENVMRKVLEGMVARKSIEQYNIGFQQYETVRAATLTGTGSTGRQGKIYTSQIWAGQNSIFTLQAELVGEAHPHADAMFRDVLKSLQMKKAPPVEAPKDDEDDEDSDDDSKDKKSAE